MPKIIIAGSRKFTQYEVLEQVVDTILFSELEINTEPCEIISGGANGADQLGEQYAQRHLLSLEVIKANWKKYGKSAGYKRNEEMAKKANILIAFWDGSSKGTGHMIDLALKYKLNVFVYNYTNDTLLKPNPL